MENTLISGNDNLIWCPLSMTLDGDLEIADPHVSAIMDFFFDLSSQKTFEDIMISVEKCVRRVFPAGDLLLMQSRDLLGRPLLKHVSDLKGEKNTLAPIVEDDESHDNARIFLFAGRRCMSAPLHGVSRHMGFLLIGTSSEHFVWQRRHLNLFRLLTSCLGYAVERVALNDSLLKTFDGFIGATITAIDARDSSTAGHSVRVAHYTAMLVDAVNQCRHGSFKDLVLNEDEKDTIRYAALFHDIGKIGIREEILNKKGRLFHADYVSVLERCMRFEEKYVSALRARVIEELNPDNGNDYRQSIEELRRDIDRIRERFKRYKATLLKLQEPCNSGNEKDYAVLDEMLATQAPDTENEYLLSTQEYENLRLAYGTLNPEERQHIETHPVISYKYLSRIPWPAAWSDIPKIAFQHHERLDGSGYPLGLRGNQICFGAQLVAVCDIYDALTGNDRLYKSVLSAEQALEILKSEADCGRLNAELVNLFVEVVFPRLAHYYEPSWK